MGLWSTWVVCRSFPYFVIVWLSEFDGNLGRSKGKLLVSTTGCRRMDWPGQLIFQSSVWSWRHQTNARPLMEYRLGVDDTPRINRMQLSHRYQLAIAWLGFLLRASWSKDSLMIDNWSGTEEKREKRREKEEKTEREKREREREGEIETKKDREKQVSCLLVGDAVDNYWILHALRPIWHCAGRQWHRLNDLRCIIMHRS